MPNDPEKCEADHRHHLAVQSEHHTTVGAVLPLDPDPSHRTGRCYLHGDMAARAVRDALFPDRKPWVVLLAASEHHFHVLHRNLDKSVQAKYTRRNQRHQRRCCHAEVKVKGCEDDGDSGSSFCHILAPFVRYLHNG